MASRPLVCFSGLSSRLENAFAQCVPFALCMEMKLENAAVQNLLRSARQCCHDSNPSTRIDKVRERVLVTGIQRGNTDKKQSKCRGKLHESTFDRIASYSSNGTRNVAHFTLRDSKHKHLAIGTNRWNFPQRSLSTSRCLEECLRALLHTAQRIELHQSTTLDQSS